MNDGGRLILPLTTDSNFGGTGQGAMFRIERAGDEFLASWISYVGIIPAESMRDEVSERALTAAFKSDGWKTVTRLHRGPNIPEELCWVSAPGWGLA